MDTQKILSEVALILQGAHPAYRGDKIRNAEGYLWALAKDFPDQSRIAAKDISKNLSAASEICGLHPVRCEWIAIHLMAADIITNR